MDSIEEESVSADTERAVGETISADERVTEAEINVIWSSLVEAEINLLYWPVLIRRTIWVDRAIKIAILAVAAWGSTKFFVVVHHPYVWQYLTASVGLLSIVQLIQDFAGQVNAMSRVYERTVEIHCSYEELLGALPHLPRRKAIKRYNSLKRDEIDIAKRIADLPLDESLRDTCYVKALKARDLPVLGTGRKGYKLWLQRMLDRLP
jgi:hypothetical protein